MTKLSHSDLHDRIALLERRLERRRARLLDHTHEAAAAASHAATYVLPVVAALGAGLVAMWITRRRRPHASSRATTRRGLRWGSIAGIVGSAVRIGTSPQARAVYGALRRRRSEPQP